MRYVVHCFSPINVISALAAIEHLAPGEREVADLLVYHPGLPETAQKELGAFAERACRAFTAIRRVHCVTDEQWGTVNDAGASGKADALRRIMELDGISTILYSHDVVGNVLSAFMEAIPGLQRVCYGDAMGQVFEREVHLSFLATNTKPRSRLWSIFSRARATQVSLSRMRALPDRAVLMLPVDQSGVILKHTPYDVISSASARRVFRSVANQFTDLGDYLRRELTAANGGHGAVFLLTENWAEGSFISFEREIAFYCDIIRAYAAPRSCVWIKPHPGEVLDRQHAISQHLGNEFEIRPLHRAHRRIPFELWAPNLRDAKVIAMQYPALSLKYLYDVDVIQPLDYDKINLYFPASVRASFKNALDLNMTALARLPTWDGKSPLYSGG